jgi:methionine-rich copper-binding protein CopC
MKKKLASLILFTLIAVAVIFSNNHAAQAVPTTAASTPINTLTEYTRSENVDSWFKISLKAGEEVKLLLSARLSSGYLHMALYDDKDNQLNNWNYISNGGTASLDLKAGRTATFYIKVSGDGRGKYKLGAIKSWANAGVSDSSRTYFSSFNTAKYLTSGRKTLSEYNINYYRFTAQRGKNISLKISSSMNTGRQKITLYDAKGQYIDDEDYIYNGQTRTLSYNVPFTGLYYVSVWGSDPGQYDLSFSNIDTDKDTDADGLKDSVEYNRETSITGKDTDGDTITDYDELLQGKTPTARYEYSDSTVVNPFKIPVVDQDFSIERRTNAEDLFYFDLKEKETVNVLVYPYATNNGYLHYEIKDGRNNVLKNYNYISYGYYGIVSFTPEQAGTYYIRVTGDALGKYKLGVHHTWSYTGITDSKRTYSSTMDTAKYIKAGIPKDDGYSHDWFRFRAAGEKSFTISVAPYITNGRMKIELYDSKGNYLRDEDYIYNGENRTLIYTPILTEWYYVRILSLGGYNGTYNLSYSGGIISEGDTTAPIVSSVSPSNNSTNIKINSMITLKFSENLVKGSSFSSIKLINSIGSTVSSTVALSGNTLTITPTSSLAYGSAYNVYIPKYAVKDAAGNQLQAEYKSKFTTVYKVSFTDKNLESAVRYSLSKSTGDITALDMLNLKQLWIPYRSITNLKGLEYAKNLQILVANNNSIADLTPISGLTYLTQLDISNNKIVNLSPISKLTKLRILDLYGNLIVDITPVVTITKAGALVNRGILDLRINKINYTSTTTSSNISYLLSKGVYLIK